MFSRPKIVHPASVPRERVGGKPVLTARAIRPLKPVMPELPPDVSKDNLPPEVRDRPSIFDAVKQQLGLKLVPQKGPVEYYVIDHIDRPSDN